MILLWQSTSSPVAPLLKGQRRHCSRHAAIFWRPCAYYSTRTLVTRCCRLQFLTVMNITYISVLLRQQFMAAKISGNVLKQGKKTHSVLHQRSSQLQKYGCANVSSNISRPDIRRYAAVLADTQGWQFETCKLHKNWECAWSTQENFRILLCDCYMYNYWREKNRYGLVWAVRINPPELPVNDEARNEAHIVLSWCKQSKSQPEYSQNPEQVQRDRPGTN